MAYWDVKRVEVLPEKKLHITFEDNSFGVLDYSGRHFDGVLTELNDPKFFAKAFINDGAVTWPNGLDFAPDAMYEDITGRSVLNRS